MLHQTWQTQSSQRNETMALIECTHFHRASSEIATRGYSRIKIWGDVPFWWVAFSQEIPKNVFHFFTKISLKIGPFFKNSQGFSKMLRNGPIFSEKFLKLGTFSPDLFSLNDPSSERQWCRSSCYNSENRIIRQHLSNVSPYYISMWNSILNKHKWIRSKSPNIHFKSHYRWDFALKDIVNLRSHFVYATDPFKYLVSQCLIWLEVVHLCWWL